MRISDFQCPCEDCQELPPVRPDAGLKLLIETIERHYNCTIVPSSGYRCEHYNARIPGSSPRSLHCRAQAIDFFIPGVPIEDLHAWIDQVMPFKCGLGIYNSHIHLDSRTYNARWDVR